MIIDLTDKEFSREASRSYMIPHFSVSAMNSFARNELAFAVNKIYKMSTFTRSVSNAAGNAYDEALQFFFQCHMDGNELPLLDQMIEVGNACLDGLDPDSWKDTGKTVEEMTEAARKKFTLSVGYFYAESGQYLDRIERVIAINSRFKVQLSCNGVSMPMPFIFECDLIYINKEGYLCVTDHKCVGAYTQSDQVSYKYGNQRTGYINGLDAVIKAGYFDDLIKEFPKVAEGVKEFYFYENKNSKNSRGVNFGRDQIQQIELPAVEETRALYELQFYSTAKRVIKATGDPEHEYIPNPYDVFVNGSEMLDAWISIETLEIDHFDNMSDDQKRLLETRKKKIRDSGLKSMPKSAISAVKKYSKNFITLGNMSDKTNEDKIKLRLQMLGISVDVQPEFTISGYAVDTYFLIPSATQGVKQIQSRDMDIAAVLGVEDVVIPKALAVRNGVACVQVQAPKGGDRQPLIFNGAEGFNMPIGIDNFGENLVWNMMDHSSPHIMISGSTGSGKSVAMDVLFSGVRGLGEIFVLDPKDEIPGAVSNFLEIEETMKYLVDLMNARIKEKKRVETFVFIDELADIMDNQRGPKELEIREMKEEAINAKGKSSAKMRTVGTEDSFEKNLGMILQKGRSCGMHIIAATQRCSRDVIPGKMMVNFPVRVSFRVTSTADSMVTIGEPGAESLTGRGDGLMVSPSHPNPRRFQGFCLQKHVD